MNLATAALVEPASYYPAQDQSVGDAGNTLRESLEDAISPASLDRGDAIYRRVANALTKAKTQDDLLTSPQAFGRTLELLSSLPVEIPLPEVVVESDTEIGLDWDEGSRRILTLTVRDTPMVGFAGLFGMEPIHGRFRFASETPETLRYLLARLFPRHGRK